MKLLLALALIGHLAPPPPSASISPRFETVEAFCKGCGCRGGPGWRIHRTGQCASKKNLAKECGSPPSPALCTKEN
ncbi:MULTISPECIES: hypothetical protein [unclassified Aureimonas]|uniref:hypothetical protein n=1 Tax=unclassified Aureimonas TaxID=2615206 RepID=UPI0006FFE1FD|nr:MULTISPECIES: hypothetical protein [unclassified Aureimonas]KQT60564.1 hypothetical protein ASG62_07960 [Aureimonas sp. Leaf427]KQT79441.1 hypothetical protein ASG54_10560 [Aureimonas sp. Leaf460]